jgi:hypothetical protein
MFEADFKLLDGRSLEILLFADGHGYLSYVEIDYCGNSFPVPEIVEIEGPPYHVHASSGLVTE